MTYVEGFLTPVPTAKKDAYIAHARDGVVLFKEFGATRMVEAWGEDVARGKLNDLWMAVNAAEDETVVFSWVEYPDKATRDAANQRIMSDPRMEGIFESAPFDGKRMMWGGFDSVSDAGRGTGTGYVDGVVVPIAAGARDAYASFSRAVADPFIEHGALRVMDAVADDVSRGEHTDFFRAVLAEGEEVPAFGWVEWPDKATRDAGWEKVMADERMNGQDAPFDGKRMIFGGFTPIVDA